MPHLLSAEASRRAADHLNEDHVDALLAFAMHFGNLRDATSARVLALGESGLVLTADTPRGPVDCHVPYSRALRSTEDLRATLVEMAREARLALAARGIDIPRSSTRGHGDRHEGGHA